MVAIQELDEKLSIIQLEPASQVLHNGPVSQTAGPALPEEINDVRQRTFDERFADLNRVPLFMRELDETDGANGENTELEALKMLAYDGEPWEIALSSKESGNECFVSKQYQDAVIHYSKALNLKCGRSDIDEVCYTNRAACNLELHNYGKVMYDCKKALTLNPKNIKALYRCCKACIATDRLDEAQDVLTRGLLLEPDNKGLKAQLDLLERKLKTTLEKRQRDDNLAKTRQNEAYQLHRALKSRNISIIKSPRPPDTGDAQICLSDPRDSESSLLFPTVFLYPLTYQSDFLAAFPEVYTVQSQLDLILAESPPWDERRQYTPKSVECFMTTKTAGLIKIGRKSTLGAALSSGKVDVQDGVVRIHVVPKSESPAWIESFKKELALTSGKTS